MDLLNTRYGRRPGAFHQGSFCYLHVPEDRISIAVHGNLMVDLKPAALALYEAYVEHEK